MPTYDYLCDACGHRFSAQQRFGDEPLPACPKCGARPRRLVSLPAIVFKGGGWYATDSRRAKDGGGPEGADAPAKPSEGGEQQKGRGASSDGAKPPEKKKPKDPTTKESASEKSDGSADTP